jgi:cysteine desulfurase / selenocysteine lyase
MRDDSRLGRTITPHGSGLGVAIDYALDVGLASIERRCRLLAGRLRTGLAAIPGIEIRDLGRDPAAIISFTVEGHEAGAVVRDAAVAGITIGVSNPSSTRLDAEARSLPPIVRASRHYYNTEAEIDRLIEHLSGASIGRLHRG